MSRVMGVILLRLLLLQCNQWFKTQQHDGDIWTVVKPPDASGEVTVLINDTPINTLLV